MKTKIICDPPAPNKGIDPEMYAKTIEHLLWKENERRCREHALIDSTKDFHYEEYSNKGPKNDLELVSNWKHEGAWVFHVWHSQSSFHDIAEWCLERGIRIEVVDLIMSDDEWDEAEELDGGGMPSDILNLDTANAERAFNFFEDHPNVNEVWVGEDEGEWVISTQKPDPDEDFFEFFSRDNFAQWHPGHEPQPTYDH